MRQRLRSFRLRLWALLHRRQLEKDLDDELSYHLEMSRERGARTSFGSRTRIRDMTMELWVFASLEALHRNLRFVIRSLSKAPGFTITVVLTLAAVIGANSTVFSAVDAVLLRPLPYPESERLVQLLELDPAAGFARSTSPARLEDWHESNETFDAISGYNVETVAELSGELPEQLTWSRVAPRFLEVMGVEPILGRGFTADEAVFGSPRVALISERFWRRRFDSDPSAIGSALRFDNDSYTIVGVMPDGFAFPTPDVDVWYQFQVAGAPYAELRTLNWLIPVGRLRSGVTIDEARADMATVQADLGRAYPDTDADLSVQIDSLNELAVGADVGQLLWLLFGAVTVLLLIACSNIAALLLSRAVRGQQEIAVRASLGASWRSIVALRLTESFVLSAAGGIVGLALAAGGIAGFKVLAVDMPRAAEIGFDFRLAVYAFALSAVVTLLCGLLPVAALRRQNAGLALAQAGRSQLTARHRVHWGLVGLQIALAVTLLSGAGLLVRSFQALAHVEPGFDSRGVVALNISMSWAEALPGNDPVDDRIALSHWSERMLEVLEAIPGVESAAFSPMLPGWGSERLQAVELVGKQADEEPEILVDSKNVSPSYFATLKIPLLAGELCAAESDGSYSSAVVNRDFVETYVGGRTPVGRRLRLNSGNDVEIRGVVGDAREHGMQRAPVPTVYLCEGIAYPGTPFLVRTIGDVENLAPVLRAAMKEADPRRAIYSVTSLDRRLYDAKAGERALAMLFTVFGVSALLLSGLGIYGTLSYTISARRREVGLRLALGAQRSRIVRAFLEQGLRVSLVGISIGVCVALIAGRALTSVLYGISSADVVTLIVVILLVNVVAGAASLIPAFRASRFDPVQALRED